MNSRSTTPPRRVKIVECGCAGHLIVANDNNNGACRRCGGHTEMKLVNGRWKEVTIKEPNRPSSPSGDSRKEDR